MIMQTQQTQFQSRAYADEDVQAICGLLNACDAVDKLDDSYSVEDLRMEFDAPEIDKRKDLRLWEDAEGRLVGFGQIGLREAAEQSRLDGRSYFRVHPDERNKGLEDEILAWACERAREAGEARGLSVRARVGARDGHAYMRETLERNGMSVVRYFFTMTCDLSAPIAEPQLPEGFSMKHSEGGEDIAKWVEMFNQSFIDHWNHHPAKVEDHAYWLQHAKYNPERDLIAVAPDGTFAAFCFCWIDPEDNERNHRLEGWIDILGTRRGFRKIGLGRAMLLAGLHSLKEDGMTVAKLGVDAENPTGALRLYESCGFVTQYTQVAYSKDV